MPTSCARREGIAVWQRVRVADVFRDGCRDMAASLRWQLGGLTKAHGLPHRRAELPGTVVRHRRDRGGVRRRIRVAGGTGARGAAALPDRARGRPSWLPVRPKQAQIMRHVLAMIDYFLEETRGRIPMSWSDLQNPLNMATELVETSGFFDGLRRSAGGGAPDTRGAHRTRSSASRRSRAGASAIASCGPATASPARGPARASG